MALVDDLEQDRAALQMINPAGERRRRQCPAGGPPWNRLGYGNNAIEVIYVDVC